MDYKNYYVAKITLHVDGMPVPGTSKKLRFYDDELKQSRFFNGHNFEDVIAMKVAYDDNSYGYTVDYVMHISL